jgi:hypothetical protein
VVPVDEKEVVRLIRSFARAYWRQLARGNLLRACLIGDLKSGEGRQVKAGWKVFPSFREFRSTLERSLLEGPVEIHGSLELYEQGEAKARILAFDVDGKENDLSDLKPVYELWRLLRDELGVLARVKLSGGGIHVEGPPLAGLEPVHARLLATYLEERLGGRLKLDRNIYGERHMLRLAWSWHSGRKCFAMVLKPEWLLDCSIEDLRERASDPEFLEYAYSVAPREPEILDIGKLRRLARALLGGPEPEWKVLKVARKAGAPAAEGGWRKLEAPGFGLVEYSPELEGYGWIKVLVEREVYLREGKLNLTWLVLAPAVARGLLALEKVEEWLRKAAEACGADPKRYLNKLRSEVRRRKHRPEGSPELALPTWRTLLAKRKKDGSPLEDYYEAIRRPLLEALAERGLVRLQAVAAAALSNRSIP